MVGSGSFKRTLRSATVRLSRPPSSNLRPKGVIRRVVKEGFVYYTTKTKPIRKTSANNCSKTVPKYSTPKADSNGNSHKSSDEKVDSEMLETAHTNSLPRNQGTEENTDKFCCRDLKEVVEQGRRQNALFLELIKRLENVLDRCDEQQANGRPLPDPLIVHLNQNVVVGDHQIDSSYEPNYETSVERQMTDDVLDAADNPSENKEAPSSTNPTCYTEKDSFTKFLNNTSDCDSSSVSSILSSDSCFFIAESAEAQDTYDPDWTSY